MTYLLDTSVLFETRKREPDTGVTEWIAATPPERLYLSVLTLGEIEKAIVRVPARADIQQAEALERWLRDVTLGFADRIFPVTPLVASKWGRQQQAHPLPAIHGLLAATAQAHGMTLVTRNVNDFKGSRACVLNPFTA